MDSSTILLFCLGQYFVWLQIVNFEEEKNLQNFLKLNLCAVFLDSILALTKIVEIYFIEQMATHFPPLTCNFRKLFKNILC